MHFKLLQVVQLTKFDYRLANDLDEELQRLRCRVNYHALRFTIPISDIGQLIILRMRKMARRFISVHLRFILFLQILIVMLSLHVSGELAFVRDSYGKFCPCTCPKNQESV